MNYATVEPLDGDGNVGSCPKVESNFNLEWIWWVESRCSSSSGNNMQDDPILKLEWQCLLKFPWNSTRKRWKTRIMIVHGIKNGNFWLKESANQSRLRRLYPGPNNGGNPYRKRLPIDSRMECVTEVAEVLERDRRSVEHVSVCWRTGRIELEARRDRASNRHSSGPLGRGLRGGLLGRDDLRGLGQVLDAAAAAGLARGGRDGLSVGGGDGFLGMVCGSWGWRWRWGAELAEADGGRTRDA
ncbi:hypothetical protein B0H14DRAFT_2586269 [Mycena olivaceomarginata]|nr:hypothetical protein B0H14DRAFT_2586269 [Mycena olivaceomarginata]